ncbi:MAG TPA: hypothetical protein VF952_18010 [Chloroflexia bacterium]|jgi:hypothetical protein
MSDKEEFIKYLEGICSEGWHVVSLQLENSSSGPLSIILEPMGDLLTLAPGTKYEVIGQQPRDYGIHLEFSQDYIQVWVESFSGVFQGDVALETTYYLICRQKMQESST